MRDDGIVDDVAIRRVLDGAADVSTLTYTEKWRAVVIAGTEQGWGPGMINRRLRANIGKVKKVLAGAPA